MSSPNEFRNSGSARHKTVQLALLATTAMLALTSWTIGSANARGFGGIHPGGISHSAGSSHPGPGQHALFFRGRFDGRVMLNPQPLPP
jgi:hypothetical protein